MVIDPEEERRARSPMRRAAALALALLATASCRTRPYDDGAFAEADLSSVARDAADPFDARARVDLAARCGDGVLQPNEECDLGDANADGPAFLVTQPGFALRARPVVRAASAAAFYDYSSSSAHTGFERVGEGRLFLYADATTTRLALFFFAGIDYDATHVVQPQGLMNATIAGIPPGFAVDVSDDRDEFAASGPSSAEGSWGFNQNTDGGVIGGLPFPGAWRITVDVAFQQGIGAWSFVGDSAGTLDALAIGPTVVIEARDRPSACRLDCTLPRCGDGILDGGEVCDDGNAVSGDGCAADCLSFR